MADDTFIDDTFIDGTFIDGTFVSAPAAGGVDTENKRRSAPNLIVLSTMPVPGTPDSEANRKHTCWLYRGMAAGPATVGVYKPVYRPRRR